MGKSNNTDGQDQLFSFIWQDAMEKTRAWFQRPPSQDGREILATCLWEAQPQLAKCHGAQGYPRDLASTSKSPTPQHVFGEDHGTW